MAHAFSGARNVTDHDRRTRVSSSSERLATGRVLFAPYRAPYVCSSHARVCHATLIRGNIANYVRIFACLSYEQRFHHPLDLHVLLTTSKH